MLFKQLKQIYMGCILWNRIVCSILSLLVMKNHKYVGPPLTIHHRTTEVNCTIIALTQRFSTPSPRTQMSPRKGVDESA